MKLWQICPRVLEGEGWTFLVMEIRPSLHGRHVSSVSLLHCKDPCLVDGLALLVSQVKFSFRALGSLQFLPSVLCRASLINCPHKDYCVAQLKCWVPFQSYSRRGWFSAGIIPTKVLLHSELKQGIPTIWSFSLLCWASWKLPIPGGNLWGVTPILCLLTSSRSLMPAVHDNQAQSQTSAWVWSPGTSLSWHLSQADVRLLTSSHLWGSVSTTAALPESLSSTKHRGGQKRAGDQT